MARDEKRIELRTVDDSPVLEVSVIRLESDEIQTQAVPIRLKPKAEDAKVSQRLHIPDREEFEMRTHQPGIDALIEADLSNLDHFEKDWGSASTREHHIPWGWFALLGLLLAAALIWSLAQVKDSESQAELVRVETTSAIENDAKENQEAALLLQRIESKIRRYFNTGSVAEMLPMVRHPERVKPLMEAYYAKIPSVPHPVIRVLNLNPMTLNTNTNFWLAVVEQENRKGQNLLIEIQPDGEPLIDWETLVCYQPMDWDAFAKERPINTSFDFRVYVGADNFYSHEFADSKKWMCFRLTAAGGEESVFGYSKLDDPVTRDIVEQLNRNNGRPCTLILRINIPEGLQSRSGVVIEKLISPRWLFIDPPDSGS